MRTKFTGSARSCIGNPVGIIPVGEDDPAALGPDAAGRGLQQADHAQAEVAVAQGPPPPANAFGEVADHLLERLAGLDVRAPDVTAAVVDQELAPLLDALPQLDAAVVNLDGLGGVQ